MTARDYSAMRVHSREGFQFEPFLPEGPGQPLSVLDLADDEELLIASRGEGEAREEAAFLMRQMAYHHIAQGRLAGEPYLVAF